ncbi:MAG: ABC transporter permease [Candidatus Sericytochromatia bacterium]
MLNKYILENPEFIKHFRISFRKQKVISITSLYLVALFIFYFIMYISFSPDSETDYEKFFKTLYVMNMGFLYMGHFYIGSYLISNSLAVEKDKGTFDFLRMTTIERKVIAVGKLLGGSVFVTYLICLTIPFIILFAFLAKIEISHLLMVLVNLFVFGLLFHSMSLFFAVLSPKVTSSNSLSIMAPIFYSMFTLSLPGKVSNPFYSLFIPLSTRLAREENLSFYSVYLPTYLLNALVMFYLFYWLMKGVIRKIDSENNHIFTKKQIIAIYAGAQFLFTGFAINSMLKGDTGVLVAYYFLSLIFNTFICLIINPTKEDSIIYINRTKDSLDIWDSKAPVFTLLGILSLISLIIGLLYNLVILAFSGKLPDFGLGIYLALVTALFSFIYTQIFYLCNLTFNKTSNVIAITTIVLSTFIPVPLNLFMLGTINSLSVDLFLFNPFSIFFRAGKIGFLNLGILTQLIILIIVSLILNVLIMSKREYITKKFKL